MLPIEFYFDGPARATWTIALAHGAGAGIDTLFMRWFASGLARRGFRVARFEFPYMAERRETGKRRPPDREPPGRSANGFGHVYRRVWYNHGQV